MNEYKLYHFLKTHETGACIEKDEIKSWVHVNYSEIFEFVSIVEPQYESYPFAELQEYSICIFLDNLWNYSIEKYKDCFELDDKILKKLSEEC